MLLSAVLSFILPSACCYNERREESKATGPKEVLSHASCCLVFSGSEKMRGEKVFISQDCENFGQLRAEEWIPITPLLFPLNK